MRAAASAATRLFISFIVTPFWPVRVWPIPFARQSRHQRRLCATNPFLWRDPCPRRRRSNNERPANVARWRSRRRRVRAAKPARYYSDVRARLLFLSGAGPRHRLLALARAWNPFRCERERPDFRFRCGKGDWREGTLAGATSRQVRAAERARE